MSRLLGARADSRRDLFHGLLAFVRAADKAVREHPKDTWPAALVALHARATQEHSPIFAEYADWALRERLYRGHEVERYQELGRQGGLKGGGPHRGAA